MSEDYKKIALEDVKKGQRVRIVEWYPSHIATYEGVVVGTDIEVNEICLGVGRHETTVYDVRSADTDILLLEDAPKPKVVRTEKVTITHYDDGTKTETPDTTVWVPMVIKTMDQFREYEAYLKKVVLKDNCGDYWTHQEGRWGWTTSYGVRRTPWASGAFEESLPMTVVENVGD